MQTQTVQLPSAALAYEKYGDGDINFVIEMGLGASIGEWRQLAAKLAGRYTVLLYQRAGYGASSTFALERTPENIAAELHLLLKQVGHDRKVTVLAHSQGGLYVWKFAKMYPDLVEKRSGQNCRTPAESPPDQTASGMAGTQGHAHRSALLLLQRFFQRGNR